MFTLVWTKTFKKTARKFLRKHPDLKPKFEDVLTTLEQDPFEPALRLHGLKGKLSGLYAVSLTYSFRIVLSVLITEKEIILLDIGSHDEVYQATRP